MSELNTEPLLEPVNARQVWPAAEAVEPASRYARAP